MPAAVGEVKHQQHDKRYRIAADRSEHNGGAVFLDIPGRRARKEKRDERNGYYLLEKCTTVGFHTLPQAVK